MPLDKVAILKTWKTIVEFEINGDAAKKRFVIASANKGKVKELRHLFRDSRLSLFDTKELGLEINVEETGTSFEENASIKAKAYAKCASMWSIADDSGLEVSALGGAPGYLSARYAGQNANDERRTEYLLECMRHVPNGERDAVFKSVIAISSPEGEVRLFHGEARGRILKNRKGAGGFGYDPIFYLPEFKKTMAELTTDEKNSVSHRAKAAQKAISELDAILDG